MGHLVFHQTALAQILVKFFYTDEKCENSFQKTRLAKSPK